MTEHRAVYVQYQTGLIGARCPCGWVGPDPARPSSEHMAAIDTAIGQHYNDIIDPVVKAKIDELVETGNSRGVTPELMDDVLNIIGRPE